jgi:RecB family exonuclease
VSPGRQLVVSPSARARLDAALAALGERPLDAPFVVVAPTLGASRQLLHRWLHSRGAASAFGCHRYTLGLLVGQLALPALAAEDRIAAGPLCLEALTVRAIHEAGDALGRFAPLRSKPGLARALAMTIAELRLAGARTPAQAPELAGLLARYEVLLAEHGCADRAWLLDAAARSLEAGVAHPLRGLPLLLLDLPCGSAAEERLLGALGRGAPSVLACLPAGDGAAETRLARALEAGSTIASPQAAGSLGRAQATLFREGTASAGPDDGSVVVFSAPGEAAECAEIARRVLRHAAGGVPFDRMAVLLRQPATYRAHLAEAFRRAGIPCWLLAGTALPDPAGRALVALLDCAREGLSARGFAEYLSLGEVPRATDASTPPAAAPRSTSWVASDEEHFPEVLPSEDDAPEEPPADLESTDQPVVAGSLVAPRHWERLLGEAAVIGGPGRWERRLAGFREELTRDILVRQREDPQDPAVQALERSRRALDGLTAFALPLLADLGSLPASAPWGDWLDALWGLTTRAIRHPQRVLRVLEELQPLRPVGPVGIAEVRAVLAPRLCALSQRPAVSAAGRVWVGPIDLARAASFEVVFVPGVGEGDFPGRVLEDPILLDELRKLAGPELAQNPERSADERLALGIAVGAAERELALSFSRVDGQRMRPRVASFYALEVLRAARGELPGLGSLHEEAARRCALWSGWPAPRDPNQAATETEYDLSVLAAAREPRMLRRAGALAHLAQGQATLRRALGVRTHRQSPTWTRADGLLVRSEDGRRALHDHQLAARAYLATALERYARCPYQFYLHALWGLAPREEPRAIERLDPLARGSLIHRAQFMALRAASAAGLLPLTPASLPGAEVLVDQALEEVGRRQAELLAPAIERVWQDALVEIRGELRQWLRGLAGDPRWSPWRFELSFGLRGARDEDQTSQRDPVALEGGLSLRGAIDLVEKSSAGTLRATDHKTGTASFPWGARVHGGRALQPLLYALALEKLDPEHRVEGGRLSYCTERGGFTSREVPLDARARAVATKLQATIGQALETGFFPAAPDRIAGRLACETCDYLAICGPRARERCSRKGMDDPRMQPLVALRDEP